MEDSAQLVYYSLTNPLPQVYILMQYPFEAITYCDIFFFAQQHATISLSFCKINHQQTGYI